MKHDEGMMLNERDGEERRESRPYTQISAQPRLNAHHFRPGCLLNFLSSFVQALESRSAEAGDADAECYFVIIRKTGPHSALATSALFLPKRCSARWSNQQIDRQPPARTLILPRLSFPAHSLLFTDSPVGCETLKWLPHQKSAK